MMAPGDREFGGFEPLLLGEPENFRIEDNAMELLHRKQAMGRFPGEEFEAALGVLEGKAEIGVLYDGIELSGKRSQDSLALGDGSSRYRP